MLLMMPPRRLPPAVSAIATAAPSAAFAPTSAKPAASPAPRPAIRRRRRRGAATGRPVPIAGVAQAKPAQLSFAEQFAEANHPTLISGIHGQLLPSGGNMQLRLDPPELGALHVSVQMRDGVMSAEFQTDQRPGHPRPQP